jgi:hypothetical protein
VLGVLELELELLELVLALFSFCSD